MALTITRFEIDGLTPQEILTPQPQAGRVFIQNQGDPTISDPYVLIGVQSGVSDTDGYRIGPGESVEFDCGTIGSLWANTPTIPASSVYIAVMFVPFN